MGQKALYEQYSKEELQNFIETASSKKDFLKKNRIQNKQS